MGAQFLQQVLSKDTLQSFVYHTTKFLSKMSGIQPVAVYAMKVPPGDILVPAVPEFAAMFRVTMAAIDPSADPDFEAADDKKPARATLKLVRLPFDEGEDDEDDEEDSDDESLELDEVVICTLDPEKNYQQPIDFVVGEGEKVFFKVSGTHTVHLTGNYVIPQDDGQASLYDEDDEDEDVYDLSPDEDELDLLEGAGSDSESDELDDLDDPRVTEVHEDEDEVPKLVKDTGKGKNKRPAQDSEEEDEANLDDIMAKSLKKDEAAPAGESKKLSKEEKKRLKKLKKNDGEAAPVDTPAADSKKEVNGGSEKKVQFAKNLEQGPTPSGPTPAKSEKKEKAGGASVGVKEVQGVTVDDRKAGEGPAAKKGNRLEMRYIGKLDNGKVFDSNKSGKPFSFKLGAGEVIKGWDIGLQGIQVGGERRLVIPAHLAYGNKALPGIPKNSKLTFDIKCLSVK